MKVMFFQRIDKYFCGLFKYGWLNRSIKIILNISIENKSRDNSPFVFNDLESKCPLFNKFYSGEKLLIQISILKAV